MIVSHKHKFIFIKTGKTAGTSLEVFLARHCCEDDIITPIFPAVAGHVPRNYRGWPNILDEVHFRDNKRLRLVIRLMMGRMKFYNHMPAIFVKRRVSPDVWNGYYKFCVERHPCEKTISHYSMLNQRSGGALTVDEYFKGYYFQNDYKLYSDEKGALLVDNIIRYEKLNEELGGVLNSLGIPYDGSLDVFEKKAVSKSKATDVEFFSPERLKIIRNVFSSEINLMNYEV